VERSSVLGEGKKKTMGKRRASHLGENPFFKKKKKNRAYC
jgi:hypothetical protein